MSTTPTITQLTPEGFQTAGLAQRLQNLVNAYIAIFGTNIAVDPDDIDGETLGIFAESLSNGDALAEAVYQSFNPDTALGQALSRLVRLNGITRNLGSYGTVTLALTGNPGVTVPTGTLVGPEDGSSQWQTLEDATFDGSGNATCDAQCTTIGAINVDAGDLIVPINALFGWDTVTNPSAAIPGSPQETDEELRIRRTSSVATPSQGMVDSQEGALANLTGVTQARVFENYEDTPDGNGQGPHSTNAVVIGGVTQDILDTIWLKKSGGCTLIGAQVGTVVDSRGNQHTVKFDRPAPTTLYIAIALRKLSNWPTDGVAQIQAALVAYATANLNIGDTSVWSELFTAINTVPGISVQHLYQGTAPTPTGRDDIAPAYNGIINLEAANIAVTFVT